MTSPREWRAAADKSRALQLSATQIHNWGSKEIQLGDQGNTIEEKLLSGHFSATQFLVERQGNTIREAKILGIIMQVLIIKLWCAVHETKSSFEQSFFLQHKPRWIYKCPSWAEINPSFSSEIENLNFLFTDFSSSNIIRLLVAKHYGQDLS